MYMTVRRKIYDLKFFFGIQWLMHRRLLIWIGVFMLAGATIALITVFNPGVNPELINRNLIDTNILNIITPIARASFGRFIAVRLIEFTMVATLIFILCQTKFTSLFVFPFIAFQASTITINLYWILARLSLSGRIVLFLF